MDTWIELITEPMRSEMFQLELLCREVIESLRAIICGIFALYGALWLVAALGCTLQEGRHLSQSHDAWKAGERRRGSSGERFSQTATRLSQDRTSAAA